MHYRDFARKFDSDLALDQMLAVLNEVGPWTWGERDSDRLGVYLSTGVLSDPERGYVKIFIERSSPGNEWGEAVDEDAYFVVQVALASEQSEANALFDEIERKLMEQMLPAIGARDVADTLTSE